MRTIQYTKINQQKSLCLSMLKPWKSISFLKHIWKNKLITLYAFCTCSGGNGHRFWSLAKNLKNNCHEYRESKVSFL